MSLDTNPLGEAGELGEEEESSSVRSSVSTVSWLLSKAAEPTKKEMADDLTKDDELLCEELFGTSESKKRRIDDPNSAIASREEEREAAAHTKTRQDKRDARRHRREVEGTKEDASKSKDEKPQAEEREWHGRGWSSRRWSTWSSWQSHDEKRREDERDGRRWQERKDDKRRADEREWQERKDEKRRAEERELAGREALLAALAAAAAEGDKHERLGAPKEHSLVPLIHGQPRDRGRVPVLKGSVARAAAAAAATNTKLWVQNVGTPEAPKLRQFAHGSFVFSETRGGWLPLDRDDELGHFQNCENLTK